MEEEEVRLITFGDFFKVVFNKKWIVIAITIAAIIIGSVLTLFVINPSKIVYQMYFTMDYPGKSEVYPDGKTFRFQDMVSLENMKAVKASDEKFSSINVEKISKNNNILVYSTAVVNGNDADQSSLTINDKLYEYRFVADAKCFPNKEVANAFLRALAEYPAKYTMQTLQNVDFAKELELYSSAKTFEEKLDILNKQYDYIVGQYESLISIYGKNLVVNEKPLSSYLNDLNTTYDSYDRQVLADTLEMNGYVVSPDLIEKSNDALVYELQGNTKKLEVLKSLNGYGSDGSVSTAAAVVNQVTELTSRNNSIWTTFDNRGVEVDRSNEMRWTWSYKNGVINEEFIEESRAFGADLDIIKTKLEAQALTCKNVMTSACEQQSRLICPSEKLEEYNDTSLVTTIIISFVLGFVIAVAIVLIVDMPKYIRKKKQELEAECGDDEDCGSSSVRSEQIEEAAAAQEEAKQ